MVQVDVLWSYGLSAGLAFAGKKAIKKAPSWWDNRPFLFSVLWTSIIFVPSGLLLLWTNPGWETMFVARDHASIPAWLVTLFGLTNATQGILGFYVTARFIRRSQLNLALLQTVWSHVAMLFILVVGWDGTGYRRFLYAGTGEQWHQGVELPLVDFFSSPIFFSLLGLGVVFLPTYFGLIRILSRAKSR